MIEKIEFIPCPSCDILMEVIHEIPDDPCLMPYSRIRIAEGSRQELHSAKKSIKLERGPRDTSY